MGRLNGPLVVGIMMDSAMEENYMGWIYTNTNINANRNHYQDVSSIFDNHTRRNDEEREPNNDHGFSTFDKDLVRDNAHYHEGKNNRKEVEEYVVIKEHEYNDLTRTNEDACHTYREIFRIMDEGWLVTKAKD
ncbi:hypothetical protein Tco_0221878 [Tanacetum coccineum]